MCNLVRGSTLAALLLLCSLPLYLCEVRKDLGVELQGSAVAAALRSDQALEQDTASLRRLLQDADDDADAAAGSISTAAGAPAAASEGDASSTAAAAVPPVAAAPGCSVRLANSVETFDACAPLTGTPGNYTFAWKLLPDNRLRGAIDAVHPGRGFVGWGQGTYRMMVPGNAVIVKPDAASPSGASAAAYHLGGYEDSDVKESSDWKVTDIQAAAGAGGRLTAAFTLDLDSAGGSKDSFPVIYVMGPLGADGDIHEHDPEDAGAATLDLMGATVTKEEARGEDESPRRDHNLPAIHGWLAAVGLGILMPLAAAFPAVVRDTPPPFWFNMHRVLAGLGFLLGVASIGIGLYMEPFVGEDEDMHKSIGVAVLALACLQVLAIVLRPKPESKLRRFWNPYHHWVGRALLVLIIANMYLGIHLSGHINESHRKNWYIAYSVILGAIVLLAIGKATFNVGTHSGIKGDKKRALNPAEGDKEVALGKTAGAAKTAGNAFETNGNGVNNDGISNGRNGYSQV